MTTLNKVFKNEFEGGGKLEKSPFRSHCSIVQKLTNRLIRPRETYLVNNQSRKITRYTKKLKLVCSAGGKGRKKNLSFMFFLLMELHEIV